MDNQQPAATAGQPNGVFIDANTAQMLQQQGIQLPYAMPGQPTQQTFQQQTPNPAPAGTMAAMGQGGWQVQQHMTHQTPPQVQYAMPQHPLTAAQASRLTAANGQTEPGSPLERRTIQQQLQELDGLLTRAIDEGVERRIDYIMGILNGQQQQVNGVQQVEQPFFDTTTGKVVIGAGGVGIGVLGTKIFGSIFGGNSSHGCSANDINALGNAFKQLLR